MEYQGGPGITYIYFWRLFMVVKCSVFRNINVCGNGLFVDHESGGKLGVRPGDHWDAEVDADSFSLTPSPLVNDFVPLTDDLGDRGGVTGSRSGCGSGTSRSQEVALTLSCLPPRTVFVGNCN